MKRQVFLFFLSSLNCSHSQVDKISHQFIHFLLSLHRLQTPKYDSRYQLIKLHKKTMIGRPTTANLARGNSVKSSPSPVVNKPKTANVMYQRIPAFQRLLQQQR